jgi:hypothetical protein
MPIQQLALDAHFKNIFSIFDLHGSFRPVRDRIMGSPGPRPSNGQQDLSGIKVHAFQSSLI